MTNASTITPEATAEEMQAVHDENVRALTARVTAIKESKVDAVADTRALTADVIEAGDNHPAQVLLSLPNGMRAQIGEVAHQQFSQRLNITKTYYDRMVTEAPALLAQNLNYWFRNTPEDRLLRFLRPAAYSPEDQRVMASTGATLRLRGVLGKGYRTIDDADLVAAILPTLIERGATLQEFSIDERRLHAAFYTPARDIAAIREAHAAKLGITVAQLDESFAPVRNGRLSDAFSTQGMRVGEMIASGVTIRHSEVGFASLGASFVQKVLKCLNRMVEENAIAIRHVGGKNGAADEDVRFISDATQVLDNAALLSRVQDTISAQFSDEKVVERASRVLWAKATIVNRPEAPLFEFVGNIGTNLGFNEAQIDDLKAETQKSVIEEGGEVKFAFVQGITAVARKMTDYDRRLEVERAGFQLLNDDAGALVKLGRDAERNALKRRN